MEKATEFRGTDNLWIAEVTADNDTAYTAGTPKDFAPTAQVSKEVQTSSETHYYSNVGMVTVAGKGDDTITVTTPVIPLEDLAWITGQTYDSTTGALIEGEPTDKYFAIMYRIEKTDGTWRYVTKPKAKLTAPPTEVSVTRDDGTTTNNQQLTFTCTDTIHKFTMGDKSKHTCGISLDESDDKCDFTNYFEKVRTPDNLSELVKTQTPSTPSTP